MHRYTNSACVLRSSCLFCQKYIDKHEMNYMNRSFFFLWVCGYSKVKHYLHQILHIFFENISLATQLHKQHLTYQNQCSS